MPIRSLRRFDHFYEGVDILFVGNLHPAVQRERLYWLGRLARLADKWKVVILCKLRSETMRCSE